MEKENYFKQIHNKNKKLEFQKRPIAAVADNVELRNVKSLNQKKCKNISLLFDYNRRSKKNHK